MEKRCSHSSSRTNSARIMLKFKGLINNASKNIRKSNNHSMSSTSQLNSSVNGVRNSWNNTLRPLSFHSANNALWKEAPSRGSYTVKQWSDGEQGTYINKRPYCRPHRPTWQQLRWNSFEFNTLHPLSFQCACGHTCTLEGGPFGGVFSEAVG